MISVHNIKPSSTGMDVFISVSDEERCHVEDLPADLRKLCPVDDLPSEAFSVYDDTGKKIGFHVESFRATNRGLLAGVMLDNTGSINKQLIQNAFFKLCSEIDFKRDRVVIFPFSDHMEPAIIPTGNSQEEIMSNVKLEFEKLKFRGQRTFIWQSLVELAGFAGWKNLVSPTALSVGILVTDGLDEAAKYNGKHPVSGRKLADKSEALKKTLQQDIRIYTVGVPTRRSKKLLPQSEKDMKEFAEKTGGVYLSLAEKENDIKQLSNAFHMIYNHLQSQYVLQLKESFNLADPMPRYIIKVLDQAVQLDGTPATVPKQSEKATPVDKKSEDKTDSLKKETRAPKENNVQRFKIPPVRDNEKKETKKTSQLNWWIYGIILAVILMGAVLYYLSRSPGIADDESEDKVGTKGPESSSFTWRK